MPDVSPSWSWIWLILLGSFHGLNPAMGWLFAVALGIQKRRTRAVAAALGPIAIGHAIAISVVVLAVWVLGTMFPQDFLMVVGGASMLGFALYKVVSRFRHPAWVGMRVRSRELVAWSFLMATAHGAGLMLVPALLNLRDVQVSRATAHAGSHTHHSPDPDGGLLVSLAAVGVHSTAMLVVAGGIAILVYERLGVDVLRRAWINMDLVWVAALIVTGALTLSMAVLPLLT